VRDGAPPGLNEWFDSVTRRLNELFKAGTVAAVEVDVWGQRVRCPPRAESEPDCERRGV
jgi:hypothetical protein